MSGNLLSSVGFKVSFQAYISAFSIQNGQLKSLSVLEKDHPPKLLVNEFAILLHRLRVPACYILPIDTKFIGSGAQFNVSRGTVVLEPEGETSDPRGPPLRLVAIKKPKFMLDAERKLDLSDPKVYRQLREIVVEIMALYHPHLRRHPNIVNLEGWGLDSMSWHDPPFIVLELAKCDLDKVLRTSQICNDETRLSIFSDIANGLDAIHEVGLIHGDLKPDNVLLFRDGKDWIAKLADFAGGANLAEGGLLAGRGTIGWRAPELRKYYEYGEILDVLVLPAIDVYSYGLMLWSAFRGSADPPPGGEEPEAQAIFIRDIDDHRVNLSAAAFKSLSDIIPAILSQNPTERPSRLGDMALFTEIQNRGVELGGSNDSDTSSDIEIWDWEIPEIDISAVNSLCNAFDSDPHSISPSMLFALFMKMMGNHNTPYDAISLRRALELLRASAEAGTSPARALIFAVHEYFGSTIDTSVRDKRRAWETESASAGALFLLKRLQDDNPAIVDSVFASFQKAGGFNQFYQKYPMSEALKQSKTAAPETPWNDRGDTLLHLLASWNNPDCLVQLERHITPENVNCRNFRGATPLYYACKAGAKDAVLLLLSRGSDPRITIHLGTSCLHWLIAFHPSDVQTVATELVKHNAMINAISTAENPLLHYPFRYPIGTPLHWAIEFSRREAVLALLSNGADPSCRDGLQRFTFMYGTPEFFPGSRENLGLHREQDVIAGHENGSSSMDIAVRNWDYEVLNDLLSSQATRNVSQQVIAPTLFHQLNTGYWRWISDRAAFPDRCVRGVVGTQVSKLRQTISTLQHYQFDIDSLAICGLDGSTATTLMLATQMGSLDLVQELLAAGSDVNVTDNNGDTALAYIQSAAIRSRGRPCLDAYFASYEQVHLEISKALLAHGARVDTRSRYGRTPLFRRANCWHIQGVSLLLDHGASPYEREDIPIRNSMNMFCVLISRSPWMAFREGDQRLVAFFRQHLVPLLRGPQSVPLSEHEIDRADLRGGTLLHYAVEKGLPKCVALLLDMGASVNSVRVNMGRNNQPVTPLDLAVQGQQDSRDNKMWGESQFGG